MITVNAALRRSLHAPALLLLLVLGACASTPKKSVTTAAAPIVAPTPAAAPAVPPTVVASPLPEAPTPFDLEREDIRAFIEDVSTKNSIPVADIRALLAQGMHQPRIIAAITRPAESVLRWFEYSNRLVSAERVARGVEFARGQSARLEAVHTKTGVSPEYIVAIIGIETNYGRNKGSWRVLDALMTLGFNYPPRSRFFRAELEQFLLLVREEKLDPLATLGSYAGAMGAPQFMPSSYRRYAVNGALDGASDARRDLFDNWDDVIGSVANYFVEHGWQREQPAIIAAEANADTMALVMPTLDRRNLELNETAAGARARGFALPESISDDTRVILLPAELTDRANVRIGLRNFYVITRYNHSILYAMAVHDLATAIAAELAKPAPPAIATP
ncbi:MAG: lytic murein transglycosylase B [Gammaproteobacteria bacterium]|nr:lytic murein transglycosylase B [Gammaproteobacteria bacterium]MBM4229742.1 lytic murein transglycosylase B [Gammaproteobacteria bacterium]